MREQLPIALVVYLVHAAAPDYESLVGVPGSVEGAAEDRRLLEDVDVLTGDAGIFLEVYGTC